MGSEFNPEIGNGPSISRVENRERLKLAFQSFNSFQNVIFFPVFHSEICDTLIFKTPSIQSISSLENYILKFYIFSRYGF